MDGRLAGGDEPAAELVVCADRGVAGVVEDALEAPDEAGVVGDGNRRGYVSVLRSMWTLLAVLVLVKSSSVHLSVNVSMSGLLVSPPLWSR